MDKRTKRAVVLNLTRALAYIDKRGWCQHTLRDDWGQVCASGAIDFGSPRQSWRTASAAQIALEETLCERPDFRPSLILFNDAPDRTKSQVRALFQRTIARLEQELAA